jgi:adenylylsulfate kinase-like enzyme
MTVATHQHTAAGAAGDRAMAAPVPVLLITGPVGVGKSTIAAEAAWLLRQADVPHALVDLDRIEQCWPVPADDPWNERVSHRNLACMWANFRQAGADRLILTRVLETRSLLRRVTKAVPGAQITVVRLRAPLAVLHQRVRSREASDPDWFLAPPPTPRRCWSGHRSKITWWTTRTGPRQWSPRKCCTGSAGCRREPGNGEPVTRVPGTCRTREDNRKPSRSRPSPTTRAGAPDRSSWAERRYGAVSG